MAGNRIQSQPAALKQLWPLACHGPLLGLGPPLVPADRQAPAVGIPARTVLRAWRC